MRREFILRDKNFCEAKTFYSADRGYELIKIDEDEYKLRFLKKGKTEDTILFNEGQLRSLFFLLSKDCDGKD